MEEGGAKSKRNTITPELPDELICDKILVRLPVRTLVRFKSVSKSWLSLFSSPKFVKDHLTRCAIQNPKAYDCLVVKKDKGICILFRYKEELELSCDNLNNYQLVGAVGGLVCLRNRQKLLLWNPAIHQSKEFTFPSDCFRPRNLIGLGFDPENNDYKVVVSYHSAAGSRSAKIYSSKSDSWNDIFVPGYDVFPDNLDTPTTIVKDCPYWTFDHTSSVKFDATSNEFKLLPKFFTEENYEFVNMNDHLTLMEYEKNASNCKVYVHSLDEGCGVWNKMYSVELFSPPDLQCKNWCLSQGFKYGGEIVFQESGQFYCYDHRTDPETHTLRRINGTRSVSSNKCFSYTPSLVFLEGMTAISQTPRTLVLRIGGNNGFSMKWI